MIEGTGLNPLYGKPSLWAGSRVERGKIAISVLITAKIIVNCVHYTLHSLETWVGGLETHGLREFSDGVGNVYVFHFSHRVRRQLRTVSVAVLKCRSYIRHERVSKHK